MVQGRFRHCCRTAGAGGYCQRCADHIMAYVRVDTRSLFLAGEPRRGWRHIAISKQGTMQDFAHR